MSNDRMEAKKEIIKDTLKKLINPLVDLTVELYMGDGEDKNDKSNKSNREITEKKDNRK
tara:strand:+ start:295 stop:471 length:177 start_codon:yes stop_codon:yes gene_type:complete